MTKMIRGILLPGALLGICAAAVHASPVSCSSISTVADAVNANASGGCQAGNLVFSNFSFNFQSGTSNQSGANPQTPPANQVGLDILDDGGGVYSLITDFSSSTPAAAVTATNNMSFTLQYSVTETAPGSTISEIDGAAQIGVNMQSGPAANTDAFGTYQKSYCDGAAYGDSGGANPIPLGTCGTSSSTVESSIWNASNGFATPGDPTDSGNQNVQNGSKTDLSLTSAGIFDQVQLNGGSHDSPTSGQYQAALNNFENDFVETSGGATAPEPAAFVLLGGGLVAIGFARRKKIA